MINWEIIKTSFSHAFTLTDGQYEIDDEDRALLDRLARFLVKKHLAFPAILLAHTLAPLNFVGSSVLIFLKPTLGVLFTQYEYDRITQLLEKRSFAELLIAQIEKSEAHIDGK